MRVMAAVLLALVLSTAARAEDSAGPKLLAAAEPFETLTEESFSAKPAQLDRRIGEAETAAGQVQEPRFWRAAATWSGDGFVLHK